MEIFNEKSTNKTRARKLHIEHNAVVKVIKARYIGRHLCHFRIYLKKII